MYLETFLVYVIHKNGRQMWLVLSFHDQKVKDQSRKKPLHEMPYN